MLDEWRSGDQLLLQKRPVPSRDHSLLGDKAGFGPRAKTEESHSVNYSNRSASVGFTADARRAGMTAAPNAVEHRTKVAARIVTGSVGLTPYSCDSTRRPNAQMQGKAIAVPAAIITSASRSTSQIAERRVAPSANRIPISRVRWITTNDITPYRPTIESRSANVPKLLEREANIRSVFKDRLTCSSSVRKEAIGKVGSALRMISRIAAAADSGVPRNLT